MHKMRMTLKQASLMVDLTEDEFMYEHQQGNVTLHVNEDTMAWEVEVDDVLSLKKIIDERE